MPVRARTEIARRLRQDATDVEKILWRALRERIGISKFRRQHPIGRRIADFACPSRKLVIELDGSQHSGRTGADEQRAAEIAHHGYRIIRFWNNDVLENLEEVLETIRHALEAPPPLRPEGRRGADSWLMTNDRPGKRRRSLGPISFYPSTGASRPFSRSASAAARMAAKGMPARSAVSSSECLPSARLSTQSSAIWSKPPASFCPPIGR
jgi:very-short-patch-repair endonuclease